MTRERALELASGLILSEPPPWDSAPPGTFQDIIANAILAAVAEEREACAKIAEGIAVSSSIAEMIAAKIRARN